MAVIGDVGRAPEERRSGSRPRRGAAVVAAAATVALVLSACSSSSSTGTNASGTVAPANQAAPTNEGAPTEGGELRVGLPAEIDGLDPMHSRWSLEGNLIGSALYDTLMTFDENRTLIPHLAESVTPNSDGTVWTIKLRPNITFSDGSKLDAAAVKVNIDGRKADPLSGGALAPIKDVAVTDPLTTTVTMSTPWFGYDYTLAAQGGYMEAPSQAALGNAASKTAIGTGPFTLVGSFSSGTPIKVVKNPNYWGDKAHLDDITFTALVDPTARTNALKAHDMDLIFTDNGDAIAEFRSEDGIKQVEDVTSEEEFAMMNQAMAPMDNIHARRALVYATDQQAVIDATRAGVAPMATGPFNQGEQYYPADANYPGFDLQKAKDEVDAYKKDTGQSTLSFTLSTSPGEQKVAEVLQAQWALAGADVKVEAAEQSAFLSTMFFSKFQVAMFRNFAYVNPDSDYIFWHSSQAKGIGKGSINFNQLKDPKLDDLLDKARANPDVASRTKQYIDITPELNETLPYVWLFHDDWALAAQSKVGGLSTPQKLGFARQDSKPWWNKLWLTP
jgi:peptide/nickel transport system substrate-binding protein